MELSSGFLIAGSAAQFFYCSEYLELRSLVSVSMPENDFMRK